MKKTILTSLFFLSTIYVSLGQNTDLKIDTVVYKKVDTVTLVMKVIYPPSMDKSKKYPGMVFFFGGGWVGGTINHFELQANYFSRRGLVCFLVDYRVKNRHGTSIKECIMDAKSSIRYIRKNAEHFNVDKNKIIGAGGSSGGHLAAATAIVTGNDDPHDNLSINPSPNALVLFNPAIDLGPSTSVYARDSLKESYKDISPLHNVKKGAPPTIFFLGTKDRFIPVETAKYYALVMRAVGSRCDLFLYEDQEHGFFNFVKSEEHYKKTVYEADKFLISLGYLEGKPTIMNED